MHLFLKNNQGEIYVTYDHVDIKCDIIHIPVVHKRHWTSSNGDFDPTDDSIIEVLNVSKMKCSWTINEL